MISAGEKSGRPALISADRKPSIRQAAVADFRGATWRQRLALVGAMSWIAYEWGPGNETLTPWLLARVIAGTESAWVIPLAALVGFGFTAVQQLASGFTALAGFSMFDRTSRAAWNRLRGVSDTAPGEWSRLGWVARSAIVFPLGTTSVALIQIMTTGEVGVRRHGRVVATSALLCAGLVGALGAIAANLALVGRSVPALQGATNWILRVLGNPLFWLILIVVSLLARRLLTLGDRTDATNEGSTA
jgi:hypothetical protein